MQEEQSKNTEINWTILNASTNCPYNECDGSGMSILINNTTKETKADIANVEKKKYIITG